MLPKAASCPNAASLVCGAADGGGVRGGRVGARGVAADFGAAFAVRRAALEVRLWIAGLGLWTRDFVDDTADTGLWIFPFI